MREARGNIISDVARTAIRRLMESEERSTREEKVAAAIRDLESKIDAFGRRMQNPRGELANEAPAKRLFQELTREEPHGPQ